MGGPPAPGLTREMLLDLLGIDKDQWTQMRRKIEKLLQYEPLRGNTVTSKLSIHTMTRYHLPCLRAEFREMLSNRQHQPYSFDQLLRSCIRFVNGATLLKKKPSLQADRTYKATGSGYRGTCTYLSEHGLSTDNDTFRHPPSDPGPSTTIDTFRPPPDIPSVTENAKYKGKKRRLTQDPAESSTSATANDDIWNEVETRTEAGPSEDSSRKKQKQRQNPEEECCQENEIVPTTESPITRSQARKQSPSATSFSAPIVIEDDEDLVPPAGSNGTAKPNSKKKPKQKKPTKKGNQATSNAQQLDTDDIIALFGRPLELSKSERPVDGFVINDERMPNEDRKVATFVALGEIVSADKKELSYVALMSKIRDRLPGTSANVEAGLTWYDETDESHMLVKCNQVLKFVASQESLEKTNVMRLDVRLLPGIERARSGSRVPRGTYATPKVPTCRPKSQHGTGRTSTMQPSGLRNSFSAGIRGASLTSEMQGTPVPTTTRYGVVTPGRSREASQCPPQESIERSIEPHDALSINFPINGSEAFGKELSMELGSVDDAFEIGNASILLAKRHRQKLKERRAKSRCSRSISLGTPRHINPWPLSQSISRNNTPGIGLSRKNTPGGSNFPRARATYSKSRGLSIPASIPETISPQRTIREPL